MIGPSRGNRAWPYRLLVAVVIGGVATLPAVAAPRGIGEKPLEAAGDTAGPGDSPVAGTKERSTPDRGGEGGSGDGERTPAAREAGSDHGAGKELGETEKSTEKSANKSANENTEKSAPGRSKKHPNVEPPKVTLPAQGIYKASTLARLAGKVLDRPVRIADTGVEKRTVEVIPLLAGQLLTLEELRLLLAFHGVYLFDSEDREEGPVFVATTNPRWTPRQAHYSHVLDVSARGFKRVWAQLKREIDKHNAALAPNEPAVVAVPVESVGKIFLRAGNKKTLARLIELAKVEDEDQPPPDRPRLFAYIGRFRHVQSLEKEVREQLTDSERARTRFVVMHSGNRLLFRAPGRLGDRITKMLEEADRPRR